MYLAKFLFFSSSTFIKRDIKTGLITKATNKDEVNVTISPRGIKLINFPVKPGQKTSGAKAAIVVAVEVIIGREISPIPSLVACNGEYPFSINL